MKTLRWILFIPLSIIAASLLTTIFTLLLTGNFSNQHAYNTFNTILFPFLWPSALIFTACYIAPKHKFTIAIVYAFIILFLFGSLILSSYISSDEYTGLAILFLTCLYCVWQVGKFEKVDFRRIFTKSPSK
jgi:hypothetical protein